MKKIFLCLLALCGFAYLQANAEQETKQQQKDEQKIEAIPVIVVLALVDLDESDQLFGNLQQMRARQQQFPRFAQRSAFGQQGFAGQQQGYMNPMIGYMQGMQQPFGGMQQYPMMNYPM